MLFHFKVGIEGGQMQGDQRGQFFRDPFKEGAQLVPAAVQAIQYEVCDLEMDTHIEENAKSFEHWLQGRFAACFIEIGIDGFEVDIGGIDMGEDLSDMRAADKAVGDGHCMQTFGAGEGCGILHILCKDHGFIVGKGDGGRALITAEADEILG